MRNGLAASDVALFRRARSIIAESLWWDDLDGLHWCDIDTGELHTSGLVGRVDGSDDHIVGFGPPVSAFQPTRDRNGVVFAGRDYIALASTDGRVLRRLATIQDLPENIRLNEAKCDPFGRFVVGGMSLDGDASTAIYSVDESGDLCTLVGGIGVSNGFEWSEDGRTMWFTDTSAHTIYSGDYSTGGELSNVTTFAHGRMSDGLARDSSGGFWNGSYDTGSIVHWNSSGEIDFELDVPAGHVTSVAFGGPGLSTLFIATARENLTEVELEFAPLTGSIFFVETSTHGFPVHTFGSPTKGN